LQERNIMSDPFDDLDEYESDIGVEAEDKKHATGNRTDWFKSEKGRSHLVSFVYFHPIAIAAALALKKKMKKDGKGEPSKEQMREIGEKALAKAAEALGKDVDALTDAEKLDINVAKFKMWQAHYKDGLGYVHTRLGKDGDEADKVWKMLGDVRKYFGSLLLIYPTEEVDGELTIDKERIAKGWRLIPWRLSTKSYETVHKLNQSLRKNGTDLAHQDVRLDCTNTGFQNFDVVGNGPAVWRKHDKFRAAVLEKAVKMYEKLDPFRQLSTADLKIKLGIDDGGGDDDDEGGDDTQYDDLINNV
jgi:hypothetical protein